MNASDLANARDRVKIVDIRKEPDEEQIPGAVRYVGDELVSAQTLPFERDEPVVLYCGSGNSCRRVAGMLRERGYDAIALEGGYKAWRQAGLPTEPITDVKDV